MANKRTASEPQPEVANYGHGKIGRTSSIKTVYVQNQELWDKAKNHAESIGISLSEMIAQSLQEFMDKKACGRCERIREILVVGSVVVKGKK
jgi:hypothetical protein